MSEELKPCPFCGSEASAEGEVRYSRPVADCTWDDGDPVTQAFFCNCTRCGVSNKGVLHGHRTKDKAVSAWNRRADLTRPSLAGDERVEALVAFARPFADALDIECDFMTPPAPFEDGFDVRDRARAALAAMDTPKGGGDA